MRVELIKEMPPQFVARGADAAECLATGRTVEECVFDNIALSAASWAVWIDRDLVCLWGCSPGSFFSDSCQVWMLSTPAFERHARFAARESLRLVDDLLRTYKTLYADVAVDYTVARRWLEWLGFHPLVEHSQNGHPFLIMRARRVGDANG